MTTRQTIQALLLAALATASPALAQVHDDCEASCGKAKMLKKYWAEGRNPDGSLGLPGGGNGTREASEATQVSTWRRWAMWAFVRVGGAGHYQGAGECPNS